MRTWTSPAGIAYEDVQTGDGRIFVAGCFYWDDPGQGWPHRLDIEDDGWHDGALLIGTIRTMERRGDGTIGAEGWMDDETTAGMVAARMHDQGMPLGVSVDLDDMAVEFVATDLEEPESEEEMSVVYAAQGLTASAIFTDTGELHSLSIPGLRGVLAAAGMEGLLAAAGDGDPDDGVVMWADSMDSMIMRCTRARIRGLTEVQIPAFARAALLYADAGAPADDSAPEDEPAVEEGDGDASVRVTHEPAPETTATGCGGECGCGGDCDGQALAAAATTSTIPVRPPAAYFTDPGFSNDDVITVEDPDTGRTLRGVPMQYLPSGEVLGHIAMWGQCHTGSPSGQCVLTPHSASGYRWFQPGHIELDDGTLRPSGNLTLGGGHADVMLSYRAALNHYDDVSTQAAQITAGEDRYGVWVHGAGLPDVWDNELTMRKLRAASPSGDWRWIGGTLELIIAHCVNGPGFPVPRAQVASGGTVTALVAAGARDMALLAAAARGEADPAAALAAEVREAIAAGIADGVGQVLGAQRARETADARRRLLASRRDRVVASLKG